MWHNILSAGSRWQQLAIMSSYLNVSLLSLFLSIYCLSLSVILSLCISLQRVHSLYVLFLRLPLPLSFFITFLVLCVNPPQQMCLSAAEQRGNLWVDSSKIEREKNCPKTGTKKLFRNALRCDVLKSPYNSFHWKIFKSDDQGGGVIV